MSFIRRNSRAMPFLGLLVPCLLFANEPLEKERSREVEHAPSAREFLIVPLKVYRLKSKTLAAADCSLTDSDFTRILGKANRIWSFAGIYFGSESFGEAEANELPALENEKTNDSQESAIQELPPSRRYRALIPQATRDFPGFRVYYIHQFDVNGIYYGNHESMVKETASLRDVPGGIEEPIPRVTAHELGHGLSLPHRQDRTNLMASGTTGTTLNEAEVKQTREFAGKLAVTLTFESLTEIADSAKDEKRRETARRWREEIRSLAAPQ